MASTIPAPISWAPSSYWDGNDGSWNSFIVQVGTPAQDFRVFPSTAGQELWIPVPDGCTSVSPDDTGYCGYMRGTLPVNGANSSGFATNESSTWDVIGIYTLDAQEADLGYGGNGQYGFDTVVWGNVSNSPNLTQQVLAGIADPDWWLGMVGLGPKTINFTTFNDPLPSFMSNLANETSNLIPSLSWAYTAGAAYRNNSRASLTLGGYDTNRFTSGVSIGMSEDNSRPLLAGVQKILADNTLDGTVNLLPTSTYHFIDSTVPHIWLPNDSVNAFVSAFGLTYDNDTDLYLINDTMRSQMLSLNPTITIVIAESTIENSGSTQNIELPYAAFDLQASYPYYQNATNYFPIRRAANDSQFTIGRAFFQEAYIIVDYERNNFTVAQTSFDNMNTQHLVAIEKPATSNSTGTIAQTSSSSGIRGGTIAGIVIGAIAGLAIAGFLVWFFIRRSKRKQSATLAEKGGHNAVDTEPAAFSENDAKPPLTQRGSELPSESGIHEAEGHRDIHEVPSPGMHSELDSSAMRSEVDGGTPKWGCHGVQELKTPPVGHESGFLAEAPGSEGVRYELPGSERQHDGGTK